MFDIAFSELLLIALVALVVIGPERLPKVARTVGHLLGRMQRYVSDVKSDISREMHLDELKRMKSEVQSSAFEMEQSINRQMSSVEGDLNQAIAPPASDVTASANEAGPVSSESMQETAARGVDSAQLELELAPGRSEHKAE